MNTSIYYFSGTGNSLAVAKSIASKIKHSQVISLLEITKNYSIQADIIGFVFPTYCVDVPDFIVNILEKANFENAKYIFVAVTCGGTPGNTLYTVSKILKQKNLKLNYGYEILLGDNSIVYHTDESELEERVNNLDGICQEIANNVLELNESTICYYENIEMTNLKQTLCTLLSNDLKISEKAVDQTKCSLCGVCSRVCPNANIIHNNQKIMWKDNCLMCFSCLNLCPNACIRFGKIAPKKEQQYKYPGIKLSELIAEK